MNEVVAPERILVALHVDDCGERAVRWADRSARALNRRLVVAASFENPSVEHTPEDQHRFLEEKGEEVARWITGLGVENAQVASLDGVLDEHVADAARLGDIVVVGTDVQQGHTSWALGTAPHQFAHGLPCPLVLVPPLATATADAPVLVGVDGTSTNELVVEWARVFAEATGRPLHAVFATDPVDETFDGAGDLGDDERRARAEAALESAHFHERPGDPADVLRDVSQELGAFLTVVGARQQHSFGGLLLGKIVDHLLHEPPGALAVLTHDFEKALQS